ncbi:hypothetical protein BCR36DRAFT_413889 [Piromyces finnis]|uniref:Uncharacterized protein n=1 Tax=Piromyces finnis TaxID=1754191 RepID=A0A1Y1V507_9FUNG|nr:hypothetical protein BCR36DRAFT_413889 [Piromyces finnis]|eukprot:ORX46579.1 hypothetical protein BCR36DRAFT_413889 [Piromyces finnis]
MSNNDISLNNKYKYSKKDHINETSIPSINKIRALYENKPNNDQINYSEHKKELDTSKRSTIVSKNDSVNKINKKEEFKVEKSNYENDNDNMIFSEDDIYNYDMDTKEKIYIENKSLKRKHTEEEYYNDSEKHTDSKIEEEYDSEDNVLLSYVNDYENSEEENSNDEQLKIKKSRFNYSSDEKNEQIINDSENNINETIYSNSEDSFKRNDDFSRLNEEKNLQIDSDDSDDSNKKYQQQSSKKKINNNNNNNNNKDNNSNNINMDSMPHMNNVEESKLLSNEISSKPSKFRPFFFPNRSSTNNSSSIKDTLSKSSSSSDSSDSPDNEYVDSNNDKGLFGFNISRKNEKVNKEESKISRKNSSSNKFTSFFYKSSKINNNTNDGSNIDKKIQANAGNSSTSNDTMNQDEIKKTLKRKRDSSIDDENNSNDELEKQKVKKIRLLQEEIKSIQQSIELKQEELRLQYNKLIKTRNSLSDPSKEPIPNFIRPSSIDFNSVQSSFPFKMGRQSTSSNFSRSSFYDYPFEVHPFPNDFDQQNSSFTSNDFRRFSNQQMPSFSRMSMDNNGRYSFNHNGPEDPSFYSNNYSNFDGSSNFNINPNRTSNINSNPNPMFSNNSFSSRYDPNLSHAQSNYHNSFISPTSSQPSKSGLFSFMRRRKTQGPESMYASSNSMMNSFDQSQNPMTNISSGSTIKLPTMDVSLTKPFYYYFIPLTRRKVIVHVDPLLRNAINYAKAAGNFECLRYLCEFEKIPNKYVDLRSIEEAAAHNDIDELKFLLKHSWFYDLKHYFTIFIKVIFLFIVIVSILYYFNELNEILIALFISYIYQHHHQQQ